MSYQSVSIKKLVLFRVYPPQIKCVVSFSSSGEYLAPDAAISVFTNSLDTPLNPVTAITYILVFSQQCSMVICLLLLHNRPWSVCHFLVQGNPAMYAMGNRNDLLLGYWITTRS